MSRYLTVKNWEEFQHYKDRCPPWIKLHRSLLDDYDFSRLHDASKAHLLMIWLLASQQNGRIPNDPVFLKNKLGLEKSPDLEMLINQGFLCVEQDASNPLAESKQNARLEEKRREEKKGFDLPEWIPNELWGHYEEMRKKKKKPLTDRARVLAVTELSKLREAGHDVSECIDAAVFNSWQTFYPPKNSQPNAMKVDL